MTRPSRFLAAVAAVVALHAAPAGATADATSQRLAGDDRFATAHAVAQATFDVASVAILTSGLDFPDALASTFLAGANGSPVLLTYPTHLPPGLLATLDDLSIDGVLVVGGEAAVSTAVIDELRRAGFVTDRVAGLHRYETARRVSEQLPPEAVGEYRAGRAAFVASGEAFPDALAAGPLSAAQSMPILLTPKDRLHPDAAAGLRNLGIEQVVLVGGTAAVSPAVEAEIRALGIAVRRVAGTNRQETARLLAEVATVELGFVLDRVMLARGDGFADALASAGRGGKLEAPLLLTAGVDALGDPARRYLDDHRSSISAIDVLGGTSAVSDAVVSDALATVRAR